MSQIKMIEGFDSDIVKNFGNIADAFAMTSSRQASIHQSLLDFDRTLFASTSKGKIQDYFKTWTTGNIRDFIQGQASSLSISNNLSTAPYIELCEKTQNDQPMIDFEKSKHYSLGFAYFNDENQPSGLNIIYVPASDINPARWLFSITHNTHLTADKRETLMMGSEDFFGKNTSYKIENESGERIENNKIKKRFLNQIKSEELKKILEKVFNEQGEINPDLLKNLVKIIAPGQTVDPKYISEKGTLQISGCIEMSEAPCLQNLEKERDISLPQYIIYNQQLYYYHPNQKNQENPFEIIQLKENGFELLTKAFHARTHNQYLSNDLIEIISDYSQNKNLEFGQDANKLEKIDYTIPFATKEKIETINALFEQYKKHDLKHEVATNNRDLTNKKIELTIESKRYFNTQLLNGISILIASLFTLACIAVIIFVPLAPIFFLFVCIAAGLFTAANITFGVKAIYNKKTHERRMLSLHEEILSRNEKFDLLFEKLITNLVNQEIAPAGVCSFISCSVHDFESLTKNRSRMKNSSYIYIKPEHEAHPELYYFNVYTQKFYCVKEQTDQDWNNKLITIFSDNIINGDIHIESLSEKKLQSIKNITEYVHADTMMKAVEEIIENDMPPHHQEDHTEIENVLHELDDSQKMTQAYLNLGHQIHLQSPPTTGEKHDKTNLGEEEEKLPQSLIENK